MDFQFTRKQEEYKRKTVSAEEAVKVVKSGDWVVMPAGREPRALITALAARRNELRNVQLWLGAVTKDYGWLQPGWEGSFALEFDFVWPLNRQMIQERRCDIRISSMRPYSELMDMERDIDVLITDVTPPDENGFCCWGSMRNNRKELAQRSKIIIVEVNERLIRTFGDNSFHISKIDYFVPHVSSGRVAGKEKKTLTGRGQVKFGERIKPFVEHISPLIKDGDTIQIGVGNIAERLLQVGLLNGKRDIGWHSEVTPSGLARYCKEGIITGKYKTLHQGKMVASSAGGASYEDLEFINNNPMVELYGIGYVDDPKIVSAHDNFVAINQALAIDLPGQITAESIGMRMVSLVGGQLAFAIGASLSKNGRNITVIPSTAKEGTVSCIVPKLEEGTTVSVPRTLADYVVTEYGVARLKGKTVRQRAQELIAIAHPDFRKELEKEAKRLYWP